MHAVDTCAHSVHTAVHMQYMHKGVYMLTGCVYVHIDAHIHVYTHAQLST